MSTELQQLNTAMKSLSMRREALYRALTLHEPGSDVWHTNRREIESINDSMAKIEKDREAILDGMAA